MKALYFRILLAMVCGSLAVGAVEPKILLQENFEGADPLSAWTVKAGGGRARVLSDPRGGTNHGLLLDDPVDDAVFSQNVVSRTISVSGYAGLTMSVDIYSLNDEVNFGPAGYDGVALRAGDFVRHYQINTELEQKLQIDVWYDQELMRAISTNGGNLTIELQQYDNFSAPNDGLFFDNVLVTGMEARNILVEAPHSILESEPLTMLVLVSPPPTTALPLTLYYWSTGTNFLVYPAGATSAQFILPAADDDKVEGSRNYSMYLTDGFSFSQPIDVTLIDDEKAGLSLSLPDEIEEGTEATLTVGVTAAHDAYLYPIVKSSDPTILSIPNYPYIYSFQQFGSATIQARENPRILPDRFVTVTATLGSEQVQKTIRVKEHNTLKPFLTGPTTINEGASKVRYGVAINAISDQPVTISLSATPGEVSLLPNSIVLPAGEAVGTFEVSVADDSLAQGDRAFRILAQVGATNSTTFSGTITDNEVIGFAIDFPKWLQADAQYTATIRAVNASGRLAATFNGAAKIYLKDAKTGIETLFVDNLNISAGAATTTLSLPYSARGNSLIVRASAISSVVGPLSIFRKLTFAANDIVYDAKRRVLYAVSGGSALPGHLNSVTKIDPATGEIGDPLFVGGDPHNVVITDDQHYLYVGQWGASSVRRVNLDTYSLGTTTAITDAYSPSVAYIPTELLSLAGRPLDFVAVQFNSSYGGSVRAYVNGTMQQTPISNGSPYELAPATGSGEFYALSSYYLSRCHLTNGGFEVVQSGPPTLVGSYYAKLEAENDTIFSSFGQVVDGRKMEALATLQFPWGTPGSFQFDISAASAICTDLKRSRAYFSKGNRLASYETGVYQLVADATFPGLSNIVKIVRWGETGLALLTDQADLVLVEDQELVPSGPAADLALTLEANPAPVLLGDDVTYSATIQNNGTNTARAARLSLNLGFGQTLKSVSGGFTFSTNGAAGTVFVDFGDLAPGDQRAVSVVASPNTATTLIVTAGALTDSLDVNYANNKAVVALNVGFQSQANSVNIVKLPINDVVYEPKSGKLVATVTGTAPAGVANRILTMDPLTGLIVRSIALPAEGFKLAVSEDGTTAYALNATRMGAYKVNLSTGQFVKSITFLVQGAPTPVSDIKVLRGGNDSVLVAGSYVGARIYDDGTMRGLTSGYYGGSALALLPDPQLAFGVDTETTAADGFKYQIIGAGVTNLVRRSGLFSYSPQIKSDGYYIYGSDGKAVRADLMTVAGTFPLGAGLPLQNGSICVAPDRAGQRVYFGRGNRIASFDTESYLVVRGLNFSLPANASFASLDRWGADGFVARLDNGDLAIIRSELVSQSGSAVDLLVDLADGATVTTPDVLVTGSAFSGQGIASVTVGQTNATSFDGFGSWFATVPLNVGENSITVTAVSAGAPSYSRTVTRKINYAPDAAAAGIPSDWIVQNFGSLGAVGSAPVDDPDHDGRNNLNEFLFGTDPTKADAQGMEIGRLPSGEIQIQIAHRNISTFTFEVLTSSDLASWSTHSGAPILVTTDATHVWKTYRISPDLSKKTAFYRVRAVKL